MCQVLIDRFMASSGCVHRMRFAPDGTLLEVNDAVVRGLGLPADQLVGSPLWAYLCEGSGAHLQARMASAAGGDDRILLHLRRDPDVLYTLTCLLGQADGGFLLLGEPPLEREQALTDEILRLNDDLGRMARESAKASAAARRELEQLRSSYWHLRKLQEVLPICMGCSRVRTGTSTWQHVAEYLKQHSRFLSHGYCPECATVVLATLELELDPEPA